MKKCPESHKLPTFSSKLILLEGSKLHCKVLYRSGFVQLSVLFLFCFNFCREFVHRMFSSSKQLRRAADCQHSCMATEYNPFHTSYTAFRCSVLMRNVFTSHPNLHFLLPFTVSACSSSSSFMELRCFLNFLHCFQKSLVCHLFLLNDL